MDNSVKVSPELVLLKAIHDIEIQRIPHEDLIILMSVEDAEFLRISLGTRLENYVSTSIAGQISCIGRVYFHNVLLLIDKNMTGTVVRTLCSGMPLQFRIGLDLSK